MELPTKRRADIQGLRALAILLVIAHHGGVLLPGGFIGVDVFFVISGYVIARLLTAEIEANGTLSFRAFYARRARRLLPGLTLLLSVVCLTSCLLLSPLGAQQQASDTAIAASSFTANLQLFATPKGYFDPDTSANALLHTWSLAVEEQFYFIFPITLLIVWRLGARIAKQRARQLVTAFVVATTLASFAVSWLTSYGHLASVAHRLGGGTAEFAFYMPITRAWEFGAGILVCLWRPQIASQRLATLIGGSGLGLLAVASITISPSDAFPGTVALLPVLATMLLLVGSHPFAPVTRLLSARPMVMIGDISYGWYLWHWPLIVFCDALWPNQLWATLAAASASFVLGWISYRYIENPLRAPTSRTRTVPLVIACIVISIATAFGLRFVAGLEQRSDRTEFVATALAPHLDEVRGCSHGAPLGARPSCTWGPAHGGVVLVGDSNAGHFTEPVADAAVAAGHRFTVATRSSCPFVDLLVHVPRRDAASCHVFVRDTLANIIAMRPALVIFASASTTYVHGDEIVLEDPATGERQTRDGKLALWERGVRAIATRLDAAGIPFVLVHAVPRLEGLSLATCPFLKIHYDARSCGLDVDRTRVEARQAPVRAAEQRALAGLARASTIDVTDQLCSPATCTSLRGDTWTYRDDGHISVRAAHELTTQFSRVIAQRVAQ